HEEVAADDHRLGFWMVDVCRNDRAAGGDLRANELGCHVIRDARAPVLSVARLSLSAALPAEVLAKRDELHLRRYDPGARVGELGSGSAAAGPERAPCDRKLRCCRPRPRCESVVYGLD